jgi:hypothetical protein
VAPCRRLLLDVPTMAHRDSHRKGSQCRWIEVGGLAASTAGFLLYNELSV